MKRVLLLGATGMLGSAVYGVLNKKYDLILGIRNLDKISLLEKAYGGTDKAKILPFDAALVYQDYVAKKGFPGQYMTQFLQGVGEVDHVINAIGVTIPFVLREPAVTFFVNGALPHILAQHFQEKLIHITTDCVYNGKDGFPYDENSPKSPVDVYGLSKSLGEPANCLTIRTSIIGRELDGFTGLLEWFLQQRGKTITGFAEHYWNGITTQQFGKLCDQIMESPDAYPRRGVYHVFSTAVSKYDMLLAFQRKYGISCTIKTEKENKLNRTMTTVKELNRLLEVPSFAEMLDALEN
ncbi:MAG TPA: sugar nucleotide-binding protein [Candidatus Acidoferrum sp.]|nr:sugar nucleotide-binding protein [Candidatus Acidoferrum sp.]